MIKLDTFKRSKTLATPDLLPYALLVDEGIILNKDGSFTTSWYYTSKDDESSTALERNVANERINRAFKTLGSGWCIHINAIRKETNVYLDQSTPIENAIAKLIDEERREYFEAEGNSYITVFTLSLTYLPPPDTHSKIESMIFTVEGEDSKKKEFLGDKILSGFKKSIQDFEENISVSIPLYRMLPKEKYIPHTSVKVLHDTQLEFIQHCITGEQNPVMVPECGMFADSYIGQQPFITGVTPKIGNKFIGAITIDGFPSYTHAGLLNSLSELGTEFRWSTRYIALDSYQAQKEISAYTRRWSQKVTGFIAQITNKEKVKINHKALEMKVDAELAESNADSDVVNFGYYTGTIILLNEDVEKLEVYKRAIKKALLRLGFSNSRIEDINTVEAFLGTLPANSFANVRRPLIHSLNLVDLLPTSSVYAGQKYNPCALYPKNSPPLAMVKTEGSTPFRLNLHVDDLGHTLIFGPTGTGKSTLLAFLASQMPRYDDVQIYAFDKGMSMYAINQGLKGNHFEIGNEGGLSFAPLANIKNEQDFEWCCEWVELLLTLQKLEVKPHHKNAIREAMKLHQNSPEPSLSNFWVTVQDKEIKDALETYTSSNIYNAVSEDIEGSFFQCFEIEALMNYDNSKSLPIMLYLFHKIEKNLKGKPTFVIIDEAWMVLGHEAFRKKLGEWLKVMRKANAAVILATQSISDAERSGIIDVLQESCPTKIFLPNPAADMNEFMGSYKALGLNKAQRNLIANAIPKKEYLINSPKGDRLVDLGLGHVALSFCAKSSKNDISEIKEYQAEYGQQWPFEWVLKNNK